MASNESMELNLDTSGIDQILHQPSGPLDKYRTRASFDWKQMKLLLEGESVIRFKYKIWSTMENDPEFRHKPWDELTRHQEREVTFRRLKKIIEYNFITEDMFIAEPFLMPAFIAALLQYDTSLAGKKVMSMDNFVTGLKMSGSSKHTELVEDIQNFAAMGALTITEMSHGSNVKAMRTQATFDRVTKELILHTPDIEATKVWSGILGQTATHAMLYAQLYTPDGQCHGPHQFLVPIRDPQTLLPFPGVTVGDMGPKIGMNGMDNGFVLFNQYRIPKHSLMNKHADLSDEGKYILRAKNSSARFGSSLGILSLGRIFMTYTCTLNLHQAITIAIRYAALRKQFGPTNQDEMEIIEYQTHQWRLIPYLAASFVYHVFFQSLYEDFVNFYTTVTFGISTGKDPAECGSEIHAVSCSSKSVTSWIARDGIQESREACGGHGYLKASRFNEIRNDHDANNTHEGDCNVIVQQTSNYLIRMYESKLKEGKPFVSPFGSVNFLDNIDTILGEKAPQNIATLDDLIKVYRFLVSYLLVRSKEKLDQKLKELGDPFMAKNQSQVYYLRTLTIAFFECTSLQRFHTFVYRPEVPEGLRKILVKLAITYGLWCLEKHYPTLISANYLVNGSKLVDNTRSLLLDLCADLKNEAVALVDVFAPPDFILNSVLGYSDGKVYEHIFEAISRSENSMVRPSWYEEFTKYKPKIKSRL